MGKTVTRLQVMEHLLKPHGENSSQQSEKKKTFAERMLEDNAVINNDEKQTTFSPVYTKHSDRDHFLASWISIDHFGLCLNTHGKLCSGEILVIKASSQTGFTCSERIYECQGCQWKYRLLSSPRIEGRGLADFLVGIALHT